MAKFSELLSNIESLETATYAGSVIDLEKFFLSEDAAVKKLLKLFYPNLTDEQCDDVVDTAEAGEKKIDEKFQKEEEEEEKLEKEKEEVERAQDEEEEKSESEDKKKERQERRERRQREREQRREERKKQREEQKKLRKEQLKQRKKIYKDRVQEFKKRVKEIKKEIKETVHKLWQEYLNLIKKLALGLVKTVQAIVAIIIKIVAPPWNVPDAINTLLEILGFFMDLLKTLKLVAPILGPLKYLPLVIPEDKLGFVAGILNPLIVGILALYTPFRKFDEFINKLINKLIEIISNEAKKQLIFKKATRKLRKLKFCQNENILDVADEDDREEVLEILEAYEVKPCGRAEGQAGYKFKNCKVCVSGYREDEVETETGDPPDSYTDDQWRSKVNKILKKGSPLKPPSGTLKSNKKPVDTLKNLTDLKNNLNEGQLARNLTSQAGPDGDDYLYDVLLPDGKILQNITFSKLESLKREYTLLFTNIE